MKPKGRGEPTPSAERLQKLTHTPFAANVAFAGQLSVRPRTVPAMRITEDDWNAIGMHVNTRRGAPPRIVCLAVDALVPAGEIRASWTTYDAAGEQPTVWSVWAVTATLLGHVQITFDQPFYDANDEADRSGVPTEVNAAWVRPLSSITRISLTKLGPMVAARDEGHWYGYFGALSFADGYQVSLPEPPAAHEWKDRQRWDDFIEAIRSSIQ